MYISWKEYKLRSKAIWDRHCANKDLTHEQRGAIIAADLKALPPVK